MIEDEYLEPDQLIGDFENFEKEINVLDSKLSTYYDWFDTLTELKCISEKFVSNMDSLSSIYKAIPVENDNNFLIGTLWSGVLSAYEGFVHDILDELLSKQVHSEEAIKKLSTLDNKISKKLRINNKESISTEELRIALRKATLNNPRDGAKLANHLFNTNIPLINENAINEALKIRNAFTHNNGKILVYLPDLEAFHEKVDCVVSSFIREIQLLAENHISDD